MKKCNIPMKLNVRSIFRPTPHPTLQQAASLAYELDGTKDGNKLIKLAGLSH
jgi:hypothetical protein